MPLEATVRFVETGMSVANTGCKPGAYAGRRAEQYELILVDVPGQKRLD